MSRLVPFGHVFGPLLSSFSHQVHALLKSLCKKTTKTSNNIRYPLGTNYNKERGISTKLLGRRIPTVNSEVRPHLIFRSIYRQVLPRGTSQQIFSTILNILRNGIYRSRGKLTQRMNTTTMDSVRNIAPFTCFSLFFSLSLALTHILLSRPL
jgi:hypothetical protein